MDVKKPKAPDIKNGLKSPSKGKNGANKI